MEVPSRLVENAVNEISKLPGIGKKTALRLALHLLKQEVSFTESLCLSLNKLRNEIQYCSTCHMISDTPICHICSSPTRDRSVICLVEDSKDVMAIENTGQYKGLYHILGGVISPINGVGPSELNLASFFNRIPGSEHKEVILALSPTMDGDTTSFYVTRKLKEFSIKITTIARGIPIGSELEYMDEITLGRSILSRTNTE
ncbi:MAG: recombination mediator RecR [Cytophagales bacterium]|nr:recombination mediator RecR [Cytophagales bacterium]